MTDEHIATYIYDERLDHGVYEIYANYETPRDISNRNVSWYDIYDKNGVCVNEGNPYYTMPTWQHVFDAYYLENVN